jgi:histone deacetylase complex regulatory component SIN3
MDPQKVKDLASNRYVQLVVTLIVGISLGYLVFPSKKLVETTDAAWEKKIETIKTDYEKQLTDARSTISTLEQHNLTVTKSYEKKIEELTSQIIKLKKSSKTTIYKIVRPDGTVETQEVTETNEDSTTETVTQIKQEYDQKIKEVEETTKKTYEEKITKIETEHSTKEQILQTEIAELKKSKTETIGQKSFGVEAGALTDKNYYVHTSYDFWGPMTVGVQVERSWQDQSMSAGGGIGVRF